MPHKHGMHLSFHKKLHMYNLYIITLTINLKHQNKNLKHILKTKKKIGIEEKISRHEVCNIDSARAGVSNPIVSNFG